MLGNRNPNPLFSIFVSNNNLIGEKPICLIDVGARGGPQALWQPLLKSLRFIGFDFDEEECRRLNEEFNRGSVDVVFYPFAVCESKERRRFYVAKFPPSSGFIPGKRDYVTRFLATVRNNLEVVREVEVETTSIDAFVKDQDIGRIDFMKVDVEGAELRVLRGAEESLRHVLGVETELNIGPTRDPDNLAGIDALLRHHGLHMFDIDIARYPRKSLPRGYLSYEQNGFRIDLPQRYGQIATGDAVYLRDPIFERDNGLSYFEWNETNVLKMAMIYELYMLQDCAIELLQEYQSGFSSSLPFDHLYDLLTPLVNGFGRMSYRDYVRLSNKLPWFEMEGYKGQWKK